jgi:hypothetical protein
MLMGKYLHHGKEANRRCLYMLIVLRENENTREVEFDNIDDYYRYKEEQLKLGWNEIGHCLLLKGIQVSFQKEVIYNDNFSLSNRVFK